VVLTQRSEIFRAVVRHPKEEPLLIDDVPEQLEVEVVQKHVQLLSRPPARICL
jgi:hypothetical protein